MRKIVKCCKCGETHEKFFCDICEREFDKYPDYEIEVYRFAELWKPRGTVEICEDCRKEFKKQIKLVKKVLKNDR